MTCDAKATGARCTYRVLQRKDTALVGVRNESDSRLHQSFADPSYSWQINSCSSLYLNENVAVSR